MGPETFRMAVGQSLSCPFLSTVLLQLEATRVKGPRPSFPEADASLLDSHAFLLALGPSLQAGFLPGDGIQAAHSQPGLTHGPEVWVEVFGLWHRDTRHLGH